MTLVDTSAWIEFLRATGSEVHRTVRELIDNEAEVHTTDVVVMEVFAGARDDRHLERLRRLLSRCELVSIEGLGDFETAASLYTECRRAGSTVRALTDCLIAAVAIRADLVVLHHDRDFDVLSQHTALRVSNGQPGRQ